MKKVIALIMVCVLSLTLFGCGKKDAGKGGGETTKAAAQAADKSGGDSAAASKVKFAPKGEKLAFTVDNGFALKQDAWLGFCPGTKGYVNEVDADEVDVLFAYQTEEEGRKESDPYLFEFDKSSIEALEDGDYILVLCDTDEDTGKVLVYIPAKISGTTVTLDYDKAVFN
jgi:hypothetical protein